jgi:proline racemase
VPLPPGRTLEDRRDWLKAHDDQIRQILNFEPRGNGMMCSVLLMPPLSDRADFSVLFLEQEEYPPMCGSCIIGVATTVIEMGMLRASDGDTKITFETPAGLVSCLVHIDNGDLASVTIENVASFLLHQDAIIRTPSFGQLSIDVAFGGDFYAIVDADSIQLDLTPANEAAAAEAANEIIAAVSEQLLVGHPDNQAINRCYETLFTTKNVRSGDVRQAVVVPPGAYDRSPCGTGTSARLAAMYARGQVQVGSALRFEGVLGTSFLGEIARVEQVGGITMVYPLITGRAYLTGFNTFVLERDDPFPAGFRIRHHTS